MPAITATAPAKIILFGEHAVVYGRPAIAAPVHQLQARAIISVEPLWPAGDVLIEAPTIRLEAALSDLDEDHPLATAIRLTCLAVGVANLPACRVRVTSTIPIASGLGSGAAVSVALIRAASAFLGHPLSDHEVSNIAFEVDKLHHGTPSGIDNSTITFGRPVFFELGRGIELLHLPYPLLILIADTGIQSPTAEAVGDLRFAWQADPLHYEQYFDSIAKLVIAARELLESGRINALGPLMNENHQYLVELGVSSKELDQLINAARKAGALGAKLSGGGRGGNMIALVEEGSEQEIAGALYQAGAARVISTAVSGL